MDGAEQGALGDAAADRREMRQRLAEWLAEFAHASEAKQVEVLIQRGVAATDAVALRPRLAALQSELI